MSASFIEVTVVIDLIIISLGLFTNSATLFLLIQQIRRGSRQNRQRYPQNEGLPIYTVFASNMLVADLIVLLRWLREVLKHYWPHKLSEIVYALKEFFHGTAYMVSNMSVYWYIFFRCASVVYPIKYRCYFEKRHAYAIVLFNLLYSTIFFSYHLFDINGIYKSNILECRELKTIPQQFYCLFGFFTLYYSIFVFVFLVIVCASSYYEILFRNDLTNLMQQEEQANNLKRRKLKTIHMAVAYFLIYTICELPFGTFQHFIEFTDNEYRLITSLKLFGCVINPLLYFMTDRFAQLAQQTFTHLGSCVLQREDEGFKEMEMKEPHRLNN